MTHRTELFLEARRTDAQRLQVLINDLKAQDVWAPAEHLPDPLTLREVIAGRQEAEQVSSRRGADRRSRAGWLN
jgi:hypothetical protein